jgi:serine protease inhibitor
MTTTGFQLALRRYVQEDRTLHDHYCDNIKSYNKELVVNMNFSFEARLNIPYSL